MLNYMKRNVNQNYIEIPHLTSRLAKLPKFDHTLSWHSFGEQLFLLLLINMKNYANPGQDFLAVLEN